MKRNLFLFAALVALLTFTYFFQELNDRQARVETEKKEALYDEEALGELVGVELGVLSLRKDGSHWYIKLGEKEGRYFADEERLHSVLGVLSQIKVKRRLEKDEIKVSRKEFFPNQDQRFSFHFSSGKNLTFTLGAPAVDGAFYFEVKESSGKTHWVVAHDASAFGGAYQNEEQLHQQKYARLQNILKLPEHFFYSGKLVKEILRLKGVSYIRSSDKEALWQVDLSGKNNKPKVPAGLGLDEELVENFSQVLGTQRAHEVRLDVNAKSLSRPLGRLELMVPGHKVVTLNFWEGYLNFDGLFVQSSLEEGVLFEFPKELKDFLIPDAMFFWNKQVFGKTPPPLDVLGNNHLKLGDVELEYANDKDSFSIKRLGTGSAANQEAFQNLLELLNRKADHIYWASEKRDEKAGLSLEYQGNLIHVNLEDGAVVVTNPRFGLDFFYEFEGMPVISVEPESYFIAP